MGLFRRKKDKPVETDVCVVDEGLRNMWNIFTKVPRRVAEKEGYVEMEWVALDSWEEEYVQYARIKSHEVEIEDRSARLFINRDGFVYKDVGIYRCRKIVVPSWHCNFGCKALMLDPGDAIKRLWRLYEKYKAKKAGSA